MHISFYFFLKTVCPSQALVQSINAKVCAPLKSVLHMFSVSLSRIVASVVHPTVEGQDDAVAHDNSSSFESIRTTELNHWMTLLHSARQRHSESRTFVCYSKMKLKCFVKFWKTKSVILVVHCQNLVKTLGYEGKVFRGF